MSFKNVYGGQSSEGFLEKHRGTGEPWNGLFSRGYEMKRFSLTKKWHKTANFEGYFYTRGLLVAWLYRALYIL